MGDDRKIKDYEDALKQFNIEEESRRKTFETQLEEKRRQLDTAHTDDLKLSMARIEGEIARKKKCIDEEVKAQMARLWQEYEDKVKELKEKTEANIQQMIKDKTAELQRKIETLKSFHEKKNELRQQTLESDMKRLEEMANNVADDESEEDRRQFLKKELVNFKNFPNTPLISDEDALRRQGVHINKQSICTSSEYILYKASCPKGECVVKIVVLSDRHTNYRTDIFHSSKILRNLMSGDNGQPRNSAFLQLHNYFLTDKKSYCFMEEASTVNLDVRCKARKMDQATLKDTLQQVLAGLDYMHTRAMAHLNLRGESVVFARDNTAKLVGLGYSAIYFNADTETFFKVKKVDRRREFLPPEAYLEDSFHPPPADVYSFGFLLYTCITAIKASKKVKTKRIGQIEYAALPSGPISAFVKEACVRQPKERPKIKELKSKEYFTS